MKQSIYNFYIEYVYRMNKSKYPEGIENNTQLLEYINTNSMSTTIQWFNDLLKSDLNDKSNEKQQQDIQSIFDLNKQYQSIFVWEDGPLLECMKEGKIFLFDEISLAEDAVLERINSFLETDRKIVVSEKGDTNEEITAVEGFRYVL